MNYLDCFFPFPKRFTFKFCFYPLGRGWNEIAPDLPHESHSMGGMVSAKERGRLFPEELGIGVRQTDLPVSSLLPIELLKD